VITLRSHEVWSISWYTSITWQEEQQGDKDDRHGMDGGVNGGGRNNAGDMMNSKGPFITG